MSTPELKPGWYPDPSTAHGQRFWDGERWTDRVLLPGLSAEEHESRRRRSDEISGLAIVGYILAVIAPLVGLIIGAVLVSNNRAHGGWICVLALGMGFLQFLVFLTFWAHGPFVLR